MKRILFLVTGCFLFGTAFGQRLAISNRFCNCLESETPADSVKLRNCFEKILAADFRKVKTEKEKLELAGLIEADLQKSCAAYVRLLDKRTPPQGDWQLLKTNPKSDLAKDACKQLGSHQKLYYLEERGDTTWVNLTNGTWKETVGKKKYLSLLRFKPKSKGEFVLTFLGSTSPGINRNSKPGDQYKYRLIAKTPTYYLATTAHGSVVYQFKLYYY